MQTLPCLDPGIHLRVERNYPFAFFDRLVKHLPEQFQFIGEVKSVASKRPFFVAIEQNETILAESISFWYRAAPENDR